MSEKDPNPSRNELRLIARWFLASFSVGRSSISRPILNGLDWIFGISCAITPCRTPKRDLFQSPKPYPSRFAKYPLPLSLLMSGYPLRATSSGAQYLISVRQFARLGQLDRYKIKKPHRLVTATDADLYRVPTRNGLSVSTHRPLLGTAQK